MHLSCHAWHGDSLVIMNTVFGTCILRWKWSSSQNTNMPSVRNTLNTWTSCFSKAISLLLIVLFGRFTSLKRASIVISFCFRSHFVESDLIWVASPTCWPVLSGVSFFSTWSVGAGTFVHYVAFVTAREALETLQKHPITDAQFSHSLYLKALDDEDLKSLSFAKLKRFFVAGEPASKHMIRRWKEETGIELWNYYGQTETVRVL